VSEETKQTVYAYWQGWQTKDFTGMRAALADDVVADAGLFRVEGADQFVAMCADGPAWRDVEMLDEMFGEDYAAILYEGINTANEQRMRVAELIRLAGGKIAEIQSCLSPLTMLEGEVKQGGG
jgi:hypothetical protein